ncbi:MAG TPA: serine/threonine-protein kinase [Terriglobia bacterium]|jgi:serine/threonine protein kinase|nr:serine/threonine-protein kinase [Terriglobia bacterium]
MTPSRWHQVEEVLRGALETEGAGRGDYLRQACGDDEDLRREVERLLDSYSDESRTISSIIENAAAGLFSDDPPPDTMAGMELGNYRVRRELGRGGMGAVYLAVRADEAFDKQVAIKLVKRGIDTDAVLKRFWYERRILAALEHPYIAGLIDGGTAPDGRPYFVMEYVDGKPLDIYAREHGLSIEQRCQLISKVCEAVAYAHRSLVIHRDLKPSNVLVTADGTPKLLDFGIARLLSADPGENTLSGPTAPRALTPDFASPEQARGDAMTTATDVYSLGKTLAAILPAGPELPPDLNTIIGKATREEIDQRYASVADLGQDLRRYLTGLPIQARQQTVLYRAGKFARRHRVALVTACAVALALIAAAMVSIRQSIRANREAAVAEAVNDFLQNDLLAQASAATQSSPSAKPDPHLEVRTALDRAAARIAGKFDRQPEVEAAIRDTMGQTYMDLGLYPEARKQLERALDLRRRVLGAENPQTLKTMGRLGSVADLQGEYPRAEALHSQVLAIQRRVLGPEFPDTLYSMNNLAVSYWRQGKYAQAEALESQTLEIRRRVLGAEHPDTLTSMNTLANFYDDEAKYPQAEALHSQALQIQRRVLGAEHPDTLRSMTSLANLYVEEGKYTQAEALDSRILGIRRRVLGPEHPETLSSMNNLAGAFLVQGKYAQAEALDGQALEIKRRVLGPEHPSTLISMNALASDYFVQGKYAQAEALYSQTLDLRRRLLGPEHPSTLFIIWSLALVYQREGEYSSAETYAAQGLAGRRHALGSEHPDTMQSAADLALAYVSQGKFTESEPLAREALEFNRKKQPDDWPRFRAESLLGASLAGEKKYAEAEPLLLEGYQGMLARKDQMDVPNWYHLDRAREWIVQLYQAWGKPAKAAEWKKIASLTPPVR